MVDFVKVLFRNADHLRNNQYLTFERVVIEATGELKNYSIAKYYDLDFKLFDTGLLVLQGSLHKYHNRENFNYNKFTLFDLLSTLQSIEELFFIDLSKGKIQNLEIGVNLNLSIETSIILNAMLLHKGKLSDSRYYGSYREFRHSEYSIKLYDKSKQYGLNKPCFRIELKHIKARAFNQLGIITLNDLKKTEWLANALNEIETKWHEILMFEPFNKSNDLNPEWKNQLYWEGLTASKRHREIHKFNTWKSGGRNLQHEITQAIRQEWKTLSGV
jgi:hypothetical protein